MEKSLDEILDMIMNESISIRQASTQFGYGKDFLKNSLMRKYKNDPEALQKIEIIMKSNKANSTTVIIENERLQDVFLRTMSGEISLEEARVELGNIDIETLKNKFLEFVKDSENEEFLLKYREYQKKNETNKRENVNFRALAIEMIRQGKSQSDIAIELEVTPRTISREFEKFSQDKDKTLYSLIKFYSDKVMKKQKFSADEWRILSIALDSYEKNNAELLVEPTQSDLEEEHVRKQNLVLEAERLKEEGFTQAQIAKRLHTSVSGLRRARIAVEKQKVTEEKNTKKVLPTDSNSEGR